MNTPFDKKLVTGLLIVLTAVSIAKQLVTNSKINAIVTMSNTYIKFNMINTGTAKTPANTGRRTVIPADPAIHVSNPDFENKIQNVVTWLIEFENDSYFPEREIGIDRSGVTVMIMPWRKNYGYWTDNDLTVQDFTSHFEIITITKLEFENRWKSFEKE